MDVNDTGPEIETSKYDVPLQTVFGERNSSDFVQLKFKTGSIKK